MQSRKMFQVLFMAVLCTVLFAVAAFAGDREDPKGPSGKVPQQIVIQNGGPVGHWTSMKKFNHVVPSPFGLEKEADSCSGSCNCGSCGCYGTENCCAAGCAACFAVACGMVLAGRFRPVDPGGRGNPPRPFVAVAPPSHPRTCRPRGVGTQ